ncbi:MAG: ATP synthase F1 subunit gamma [Lachnospiraceae bacterium]
MASMRDIKRRKGSIQSTQQITKAMKLVSTVKLQKAKSHAEKSDPYFRFMHKTVTSMLEHSDNIIHPYLETGRSEKKAIIVITSNRGLAGGYNSNITKLVTEGGFKKEDVLIYAIGHKGKDALKRRDYTIAEEHTDLMDVPDYTEAAKISARILKQYRDGEIGEILLAYTHFKNTVSHTPTLLQLLPVDIEETEEEKAEKETMDLIMNYEPTEEEALDLIIPKYVSSLVYGALVEALASENAARMQAMDSATSNADDMIGDLSLKYNRARQGSITQELTEIIAGAQAIS